MESFKCITCETFFAPECRALGGDIDMCNYCFGESTKPEIVAFWETWRSKPIYITLCAANDFTLELEFSEPTDEGYHGESDRYSLDTGSLFIDGSEVQVWFLIRERCTGGRDCDGVVTHTTTTTCPLSFIECGNPLPLHWDESIRHWKFSDVLNRPLWNEGDTRVYDQFAQQAGY